MDVHSEQLDDSGDNSVQNIETIVHAGTEDGKPTSNTSKMQDNLDETNDKSENIKSIDEENDDTVVTSIVAKSEDDGKIEIKSEGETSTSKSGEERDINEIDEKATSATVDSQPEKQAKSESPSVEVPVITVETKKDNNINSMKESVANTSNNNTRRKRKNVSANESDSLTEEHELRSKQKKSRNTSDRFCWRCHKESVDAHCSACPRSWHRRCIGGTPPSSQNWICGECATILRAENAETRSTSMADVSVDQLCMLLKHVVERMRDYPGSEPFWKPVDISDAPNYLDYVIKPMDLNLLESNVRAKLYGSTDAFMADAKWIQHNCIVFNTCGGVYADTSKLTNAAKQVIKVARQEVSEIEACPDCYAHGRNLPRPQPSWFIEPCRRPHTLVWAKLKGFPFWPAKAMPRVNSQGFVDVRFFGEHDRAWVSPRDMYLYSEDPPAPLPRKKKTDMDECVREITRHCRKLELVFGQFKFAPPKIQYDPNDPMQIKLMLPNYDPLHPMNYVSPQISPLKRKAMAKKRGTSLGKQNSQNDLPSSTSPSPSEATSVTSKHDVDASRLVDERNSSESSNEITSASKDRLNERSPSARPLKRGDTNDSRLSSVEPKTTISMQKEERVKSSSDENADVILQNTTESGSNEASKMQEHKRENLRDRNSIQNQSGASLVMDGTISIVPLQKKATGRNSGNKNTGNQSATSYVARGLKSTKPPGKVYKPKTRMVDKLNAEKALQSIVENKRNERSESVGSPTNEVTAIVSPQRAIQTVRSATTGFNAVSILPSSVSTSGKVQSGVATNPVNAMNVSPDKSSVALLFVVNNNDGGSNVAAAAAPATGSSKTRKQANSNVFTSMMPQQESMVNQRIVVPQKKESKAKKTFSNRSVDNNKELPQTLTSLKSPSNSVDSMEYSTTEKQTENPSMYECVPPEAGPISTRLHKGANELAKKMAQLMEEAYTEAAKDDQNCEDGKPDNHYATIHFLRLQIERMQWQHQQQIAELKHNTDRMMREMKASLHAEKLRAVEEARREGEQEKMRAVEETKRKQWCAKCGCEALFYCCWNTAYCDYPCQQSHWPTHMRTCAQKPSFTTIVTSSSVNSQQQQTQQQQQQVMPRLVINTQSSKANARRA